MADAAVGVFLAMARDITVENIKLISGVKKDFELITKDIEGFEAFIEDHAIRCRGSKYLKHYIGLMRDVSYAAEDAIDMYIMLKCSKGIFHRLLVPKKLRSIAQDFQGIRNEIRDINADKFNAIKMLQQLNKNRTTESESTGVVDSQEGDEVVGFVKESSDLISLLTSDSKGRKVVAIAGMPGVGKTTLAKKVFTDPEIKTHFKYRVWVDIPQHYNRKEVLEEIWNNIGDDTARNLRDTYDLAAKVYNYFTEKHCLVVLDNIWTEESWNDLQNAFPTDNSKLRILVTTRWNKVASLAQKGDPFHLGLLDSVKSLQLLEKKVFQNESCPSHLKHELRQGIANKCSGLPLAIVIIAGVLRSKRMDKRWWEDISNIVTENVAKENGCRDLVRLSYDNLPCHLRACFLYFGIFPQSFRIPVSTLICLWIAEGFIKSEEKIDYEKQAEMYLEELVDRNLVMVEKTSCMNKIKVCHVHDILHNLCIHEAREENMFNQIKDLDHFSNLSKQDNRKNHRRLSIHSQVLEYLTSTTSAVSVRSFLSLGPEVVLGLIDIVDFPKGFRLIRVLDVTSILLKDFPKLLTKLVHLRYIAIYIDFKTLPSGMSKLTKLQTLCVRVNSQVKLDIDANIWAMKLLRHLQTNVPICFTVSSKKVQQALPSIVKTLTLISPETCTTEFLGKFPKVKKLGIRGDLLKLPNGEGGASEFNGFSILYRLETLKIKNETHMSVGNLFVPGRRTFPVSLRQLTLSNTNLSWERHMEIIAMLCNLVVLKLKDNAFVGKYWKPTTEGFCNLEVFYLGKTDLEDWDASSHHFPSITTIVLKCENLKSIPADLANLPHFQKLDLHSGNAHIASSARELQMKIIRKNPSFRLTVFPSAR